MKLLQNLEQTLKISESQTNIIINCYNLVLTINYATLQYELETFVSTVYKEYNSVQCM